MGSWRSAARSVLRKFRYLFPLLLAAVLVGFFLALFDGAASDVLVALMIVATGLALITGYVARMSAVWPRLHEYQRAQYAEVWDEMAGQPLAAAAAAAAGVSSEAQLRSSGDEVVRRIGEYIPLAKEWDVVEIACGVGRIGRQFAPLCHTWTGCDISQNMLKHARARLAGLENVSLVRLAGDGLAELPSESADVIYCTNALPHFDPVERWRYAQDSFRVLRRGGWLYFDTVALESSEGWQMMANNLGQRRNNVNPPYMPIPSTADELAAFLSHAGFQRIRAEVWESLLIVRGMKI
ncbi:Methyltransferase type 11 [Candidatus Koribacter versatilis Ellin345]|uniref:Methyltransferase type 11 n=1 Tax=Koribacter versatilis (strain Ellin345) TaxID=204669 RepID=Q1IKL4_KORVE|nr:class I SAM-dependent methyltransferase [Candidatus Koribacter versatilis]ABF42586.1 Methyltransferase type 11 [Candidatus Koribacter versatilis Ellin345]